MFWGLKWKNPFKFPFWHWHWTLPTVCALAQTRFVFM